MSSLTSTAALTALLNDNLLSSRFQAIVDLHSGQVHGYEALIRGPTNTDLFNPEKLYAVAEELDLTTLLEKASLQSHLSQFGHAEQRQRLFLNVLPLTLLNGDIDVEFFTDHCMLQGIHPQQIVLELTEKSAVDDYEALNRIANQFRDHGFDIAIDDLGSGYSGLRQWSEVLPEYVKVDKHFVQAVETNAHKRQFIHSIVEIARTLGSKVIAEGIETQEQLQVMQELGVNFGQGYLFCKPAKNPPCVKATRYAKKRTLPNYSGTGQAVSSISRRTPCCSPSDTVGDVIQRFHTNPELRNLVVTKQDTPIGLLSRHRLMSIYASRYGEALYYKQAVSNIMQKDFFQVENTTPLHTLSNQLTEAYEELPEQDLVIVDQTQRYLGTASFIDLLKAITQLQLISARYANPLTQLPGSVPVNQLIDELLLNDTVFHVAYCDLDNFKPFNDHYGYARGDDAIRLLGQILQSHTQTGDLVSHVGGDDFIVILRSENATTLMQAALEAFAAQVPCLYSETDRQAGYIEAHDRRGVEVKYNLLSVSIGMMAIEPFQHRSHKEIATRAIDVKHKAKSQPGNALFIDRRKQSDVTTPALESA